MLLFGDGVVAALGPRIASKKSPKSHQPSLECAKALDRFVSVLGAGGIIFTFGSGMW